MINLKAASGHCKERGGMDMADVQLENGYTKIANEILENVVKVSLNGTQFRILLVVWRSTYGFHKTGHKLSLSYIAKAIGSSKTAVSREIGTLIKAKILVAEIEPSFICGRTISFNKDYSGYCYRPTEQLSGQSTSESSDLITKKENKNIHLNKESQEFFEGVWALYPLKRGKAKVSQRQILKLMTIGYQNLFQCIERYKNSKPGYQHWQNGSTFFNSGYVDYLDENYQQEIKPVLDRSEAQAKDELRDLIERIL